MNADSTLRLVTPLRRRLLLRGVDGFWALDNEDLQLIANHMQPRFFARGEVLCQADRPVSAVYGVIEGCVRIERNDRVLRRVYPGEPAVGSMAMFAQERKGIAAIAEEDTIALELSAEDIFQIFEARSTILRFVIAQISTEIIRRRRQIGFSRSFAKTLEPPLLTDSANMDIVHRVQLLRQTIAVSTFRVSIAFELARHTHAMSLLAGAELWRAGVVADHFFFVLNGSIACRAPDDDETFLLGPRDSVGLPDVLANGRYSFTAKAHETSTVLRVPAAVFERSILDNHEFARSVLAVSASQVLKLYDLLSVEAGREPEPDDRGSEDLDEWMQAIAADPQHTQTTSREMGDAG